MSEVTERPRPIEAPAAAAVPRTVVAFIGENENGILRSTTQDYLDLLTPNGIRTRIIDLCAQDEARDQLRALTADEVLFAWGSAGIGANLTHNGQSFWDRVGIPFISVLADSPCYLPCNHRVASRHVANGYLYHDWLAIQRRLVGSPQISAMLPLGVIANPLRDAVPWRARQHRMVFVKTGRSPHLYHQKWTAFPGKYRTIIEDAAAAVLKGPVGDITDIVLAAVTAHGLCLDGQKHVLFGLMSEVDAYVRDVRSTAMVRALLDLPVDIIGRGWEHLEKLGGRARFRSAIDAAQLPGLYADTQFLINTMPNFSTQTHERVLQGFSAKCCVITNENADMQRRFGMLPNYCAVDLNDAGLADRLAALHADGECEQEQLEPALAMMQREFSPEGFMCGMIELANLVKVSAGPMFAGFAS